MFYVLHSSNTLLQPSTAVVMIRACMPNIHENNIELSILREREFLLKQDTLNILHRYFKYFRIGYTAALGVKTYAVVFSLPLDAGMLT